MYLSVVQYIMVVNAKVKVYIIKSELLRREIVVEQSHKEQCLMWTFFCMLKGGLWRLVEHTYGRMIG